MQFSHKPVLLNECIKALDIRPDGVYLDGTLGGGGHSAAILERLQTGALYGIDRDKEAILAARARMDSTPHSGAFCALHGNFHDARALLLDKGVEALDGVLLDLGVSSYQLDHGARGFSYHADAPLDMRMDQSQPRTAREIVNQASAQKLARIFREYGEENWAVQIARVICDRRKTAPIDTTGQLVDMVDAAIPAKVRQRDGAHPARRVFQALRIAVNDELAPLQDALWDLAQMLRPEGRLCVIAFHSLEDRIVKNTMRRLQNPCTCPPKAPVCVCGQKPLGRVLTSKPITAQEEELLENPRARSATLRVFRRT